MMVRVIFTNQSAGMVEAESLEQLIDAGEIVAYFVNRWVPVPGTGIEPEAC